MIQNVLQQCRWHKNIISIMQINYSFYYEKVFFFSRKSFFWAENTDHPALLCVRTSVKYNITFKICVHSQSWSTKSLLVSLKHKKILNFWDIALEFLMLYFCTMLYSMLADKQENFMCESYKIIYLIHNVH